MHRVDQFPAKQPLRVSPSPLTVLSHYFCTNVHSRNHPPLQLWDDMSMVCRVRSNTFLKQLAKFLTSLKPASIILNPGKTFKNHLINEFNKKSYLKNRGLRLKH